MENISIMINNINSRINVRESIINLKQEIKNHSANTLKTQYNFDFLIDLLQNDDMKIRKNVVIIIKQLELDCDKNQLFEYYDLEKNWIVKVEIVKTILHFAGDDDNPKLKQMLDNINHDKINEHLKHTQEIKSLLYNHLEKNSVHQFSDFSIPLDVVLTTLPSNRSIVVDALPTKLKKEVSLGVLTRIGTIQQINSIRDYHELLIPLKKIRNMSFCVDSLAQSIVNSELIDVLNSCHVLTNQAYRFRIDTSNISKKFLQQNYLKKLANKIEELSSHKLVNSASNYEIELRLYETKQNTCQVFLKLYTLQDQRFIYRKETLSTSMQPYVAASIINLIYPYLKDEADVLDLCCGTGTLLIERNKYMDCHFMMGVDIFLDAINIAKTNSQDIANIHFIQKDLKKFEHRHQFDEIISNLPSQTLNCSKEEIEKIYSNFLKKSVEYIKDDGFIFAYTANTNILKKMLRFYKKDLEIVKTYSIKIHKKENTLFILSKK